MNVVYFISYIKSYALQAGLCLLFILIYSITQAGSPELLLKTGLVIKQSVSIKPGLYKLFPATKNGQVLTIEGDDISVDFNGAVLQGFDKPTLPDQYTGIAIRVIGNNITIKNAVIKGYKTGILAEYSENLHITRCDLSYNYKPQLHNILPPQHSTSVLIYPANDEDEWLQQGAGIYLKSCFSSQVDHCTISGGQHGLLLRGCTNGQFWNNNFTFLTGIGIGLYRSTHNKIMHNGLHWCVNGGGHDAYSAKQPSAGILVYEQSSDNTIAYNSATHCTNGLIIAAGQDAIDLEEGGSNDNLVYGNDFSFALTSGIELFLGLNKVINNRLEFCKYGIRGRFCYNSMILGNKFASNKQAITLQSGQEISIMANVFDKDTISIELCPTKATTDIPEFLKTDSKQSRDYFITGNTFNSTLTALQFAATQNIIIEDNHLKQPGNVMELDGQVTGLQFTANNLHEVEAKLLQKPSLEIYFLQANNYLSAPSGKLKSALTPLVDSMGKEVIETLLKEETLAAIEGGSTPVLAAYLPTGMNYSITGEWGPYDFKSPLLLPLKKEKNGNWEFELLGPAGTWKVKSSKGITLASTSGTVPGNLKASLIPGHLTDILIDLEYTGSAVITPFGEKIPAGKPYIFRYKQEARQLSGL